MIDLRMDSGKRLERYLQLRRFKKVQPWLKLPILDIGGNAGELGRYLGLGNGEYAYTNDFRRLPAGVYGTAVVLAVLEHLDGIPDLRCAERIVVTTPTPGAHGLLRILSPALDRSNLNGHLRYYTRAGLERCIDREMIHYERFDVFNQLAIYE